MPLLVSLQVLYITLYNLFIFTFSFMFLMGLPELFFVFLVPFSFNFDIYKYDYGITYEFLEFVLVLYFFWE